MATSTPLRSLAPEDRLIDRSARTRFRLGFDRAMGWLTPLLFLVAVLPILDLVYQVAVKALPGLTWSLVTSTDPANPNALGLPIEGTFEIMLLATILAVLFGLFGGIATAEFLPDEWANWARMAANMLAGTPSVIIGYVGYFALVLYLGWGFSYIAGVLTLSFFMTPYIFRTADLAFTSIPRHIREAALGSGAGPAQYILRVGTPIAFPQILTGIFLAMAIGVGETAPLVLTTTVGILLPKNLYSPTPYLTGLIWENYTNGDFTLAFRAAFILLVVVVIMNIIVRLISARYQKRLEGLYQ